jgi:competence protein ComEC
VLSDKPNTVSCVLRITAAADARGVVGACALLTGDIERAQELALVSAQGDRLRCELLLVPHHGSKTSSSEVFLDAVQPRVALVQAGYRNRYGHPAEPVMARYAQRGIPVWTSPACGAAGWSSSAPDQVRCERELARRYWHHATP